MKKRLIFHVDVNSAFVSWESAKRVAEGKSDLRLIPAIVGGDPADRGSVVLAKSVPAKKYNIVTGEPVAMAIRKCPNLVIALPDFHTYSACSRAFKDILREYAPKLQEFSIDECFLDMTGTELIYPDPIATAVEIKERIKNELGFTVNVGIGNNKFCAKMASDFEKPDKVHTLFEEEIEKKLWPLPVGDMLFCGKATSERLIRAGIRTIGDIAKNDNQYLKSVVGEKGALSLYESAWGRDDSPVEEEWGDAMSHSMVTTPEEDIVGFDHGESILMGLCEAVAMRLRRDKARAYCISVNIRYTDFRNKSHQRSLDRATDITSEIYTNAKELLEELWNGKDHLRLMGVSLSSLTKDDAEQMSLFDMGNENREKQRKLDRTMDEIRNKYGMGSIKRGAAADVRGHK
ncbi:MAG: DNA polymerase IV [Acetatifactor sp.]|nr:DNA polymerase IV [Acetatifactor sp.]